MKPQVEKERRAGKTFWTCRVGLYWKNTAALSLYPGYLCPVSLATVAGVCLPCCAHFWGWDGDINYSPTATCSVRFVSCMWISTRGS